MDGVALGIDLGGTKTLVGVAGEPPVSAPTEFGFEQSFRVLVSLCREVLNGRKCSGIGVAIGGPINRENRTVSPLHQTEWRKVPLWDLLAEEFGIEPEIEVDTDAAAIAEAHHRAVNDLYYVTWSTGVGGGYVREGRLHRAVGGLGGSHPEFGHQIVHGLPNGSTGGCGRSNCLESLIGGKAIEQRFGASPPELREEFWKDLERMMAIGIANAWTITGCPLFVLGGSVGVARFDGVRRELALIQADCSLADVPKIERSEFGAIASFEGALRLAAKGF